MINQMLVSRRRGAKLIAGGCPLDYPEALPQRSVAERNLFRVEQLTGYIQSRLYLFSEVQIGYSIALRLETDRPSGTIITEWNIEPQWPNVAICWDYEPRDFVPKRDRGEYADLLDSPLLGVLNDRRPLRRECPIRGLLCGYSYQSVPEFADRTVYAKLSLTDDIGNVAVAPIKLAVFRPARSASEKRPMRPGRLAMALAKLA
jgi:hypothetical protein